MITDKMVEAACVAMYSERIWNRLSEPNRTGQRESMLAALQAAEGVREAAEPFAWYHDGHFPEGAGSYRSVTFDPNSVVNGVHIPLYIAPVTAPAQALLQLPADGAYIIRYDDASVRDEFFAMTGARDAAIARYKAIGANWNAHLFAKVDSNILAAQGDCQNAALSAPADARDGELVAMRVKFPWATEWAYFEVNKDTDRTMLSLSAHSEAGNTAELLYSRPGASQ